MSRAARHLATAKEIARHAHLSYAAINNYTDMGLLDVVVRKNRVRLYDFVKAKERIVLIAKFLGEGYPLRTIAKLLP